MAEDLLVRVDATTAQFDAAMSTSAKAALRLEASLVQTAKAQTRLDAALKASGPNSDAAAIAQTRLTTATDRQAAAAERAAIASKRAGEIQAASAKSAAAAQEAAAAKAAATAKKTTAAYGTIGLVAAVALGAAAKAASDFNAKMAQVESLTRASATTVAKLSDATKNYASLGISATEAADAEIELVKAGVSVKDILGGGLAGTLNLAAAGQTDVATATEIAAAAMVQFGLKGAAIPHVADLLAAGADKSLGSVTDLGEGLKYAGTTAHQAGMSIDETVGALSQFAAAGMVGSLGGTALKQMFLKLENPSNRARMFMKDYGISLYDAAGNTKSLSAISGELHDHLGGLTPEMRNQTLAVIFGSRAVQAANILYKDGAAVTQSWTDKVSESGFAAEQASGKMDSLQGDMQKLGASAQNAAIDFGQQLQGPLRDVVGLATDFADAIGKAPGPVKAAAFQVIALTAAVGLSVFAFGKMKAAASTMAGNMGMMKTSVNAAGVEVKTLNTKMLAVRAGAAAAGGALLAFSGSLGPGDQGLKDFTQTLGGMALAVAMGSPWMAAVVGAVGAIKAIKDSAHGSDAAIKALQDTLADPAGFTAQNTQIMQFQQGIAALESAGSIGDKMRGPLQAALDTAIKAQDANKQSLSDLTNVLKGTDGPFHDYTSNLGRLQSTATTLTPILDKMGLTLKGFFALKTSDPARYNAILDVLADNADHASSSFRGAAGHVGAWSHNLGKAEFSTRTLGDATGAAGRNTGLFSDKIVINTKAIQDNIDKQHKLATAMLQARTDRYALIAMQDQETKALQKGITGGLDPHTKAGQKNNTMLVDAANQWNNSSKGVQNATGAYKKQHDIIVKLGESMGMSGTEARRFADNNLFIPPSLEKVREKAAATRQNVRDYHDALSDLPKKVETAFAAKGVDISQREAVELTKKYNLTPKQKITTLKALGFDTAAKRVQKVKDALDALHDKTVTLTLSRVSQQEAAQTNLDRNAHAAGGYITGAGTGTSDSIPARLSHGEYVVKAAAVEKYGVSQFHAYNSMSAPAPPRYFASGGPVSGHGGDAGLAREIGALRAEIGRMRGGTSVSVGTVQAHDYRDFLRQMQSSARAHAAARG